jgi:hypothetical protein
MATAHVGGHTISEQTKFPSVTVYVLRVHMWWFPIMQFRIRLASFWRPRGVLPGFVLVAQDSEAAASAERIASQRLDLGEERLAEDGTALQESAATAEGPALEQDATPLQGGGLEIASSEGPGTLADIAALPEIAATLEGGAEKIADPEDAGTLADVTAVALADLAAWAGAASEETSASEGAAGSGGGSQHAASEGATGTPPAKSRPAEGAASGDARGMKRPSEEAGNLCLYIPLYISIYLF